MARLIIKFTYGNWYMSSTGSDGPGFRFLGKTAEEQFVKVQQLQNAMVQGSGSVQAELPNLFDAVNNGQEPEIMNELFTATDELFYEGTLVYESTEGANLFGEIVEAGEALAGFI